MAYAVLIVVLTSPLSIFPIWFFDNPAESYNSSWLKRLCSRSLRTFSPNALMNVSSRIFVTLQNWTTSETFTTHYIGYFVEFGGMLLYYSVLSFANFLQQVESYSWFVSILKLYQVFGWLPETKRPRLPPPCATTSLSFFSPSRWPFHTVGLWARTSRSCWTLTAT